MQFAFILNIKNGEKIAKGSAFISANWASLRRYQSYMVLVTHTIIYYCYCPCIVSCTYRLCLLSRLCFLIVRKQEIVFLRIVCALVII